MAILGINSLDFWGVAMRNSQLDLLKPPAIATQLVDTVDGSEIWRENHLGYIKHCK